VERALGLMCGAGELPARMAAEAKRQGWRVIAFTFADVADVARYADRTVPSRLTEASAVLAMLLRERIGAVLLSGTFSRDDVLSAAEDAEVARITDRAGSLSDRRLLDGVVGRLAEFGIEVLDQRPFLGEGLAQEGRLGSREPTSAEWADVRVGLATARRIADLRIGQSVVVRRGAIVAVEAAEGTTATIRRGSAIAGPGAVVAKAVAGDHDYRIDTPTIGVDTVEAAAAGGVAVIAIEAGRVLIADRTRALRRADDAAVAIVSVVSGAG
jgi:DUF1009 family protein